MNRKFAHKTFKQERLDQDKKACILEVITNLILSLDDTEIENLDLNIHLTEGFSGNDFILDEKGIRAKINPIPHQKMKYILHGKDDV